MGQMMSGLVAKYVFMGCLCASVLDLVVVDFVVGPRALRPEVAMPLVSEPAPSPETPAAPASAATTATTITTATPTPKSRVVARFESEQPSASEDDLGALAAAMLADPTAEIVLEGHADQHGDPLHNQALSLERATWAKKRLVELGVSASRIAVVGVGAERLRAKGDDDAAVASNRRVEVRWL